MGALSGPQMAAMVPGVVGVMRRHLAAWEADGGQLHIFTAVRGRVVTGGAYSGGGVMYEQRPGGREAGNAALTCAYGTQGMLCGAWGYWAVASVYVTWKPLPMNPSRSNATAACAASAACGTT